MHGERTNMASKKFPAEVFLAYSPDTDDSWNGLVVSLEEKDAIENDGPTEIGVYRLVGVVRATKKLVVEKKS